ncbi:peroxisomal membrane protein PEX13-like [Macrosteles quadrilineatus]|uniref:peroxisomal membrane protein PEX13-like n=1 Tax=Macrosteles quadrilineatus TaxID=74068 RepID=UPI0023E2EC2C|nr:peroxisomal membrane protein PEX13-like [Macrosteles quadrilineatus]
MSAPQKPWESGRCKVHRSTNPGVISGKGRNVAFSHAPHPSSQMPSMNNPIANSQRVSGLPPLPQRPPQLHTRPGMMGVPPRFGNYGGYGMGMSPYGSMSGYGGYGYGSYPMGGGFENRFLQVAEEGSRDAFQSIESIVGAFTSVSMMLESTYYAMHSSFHAVLGVVDNFSRLRQMFVSMLSTLTLLKIIRNFYRRLLYWLGVLDHNPQADRIWDSVHDSAEREGAMLPGANTSKWPLITFLGLLFGGPYLISKFVSSHSSASQSLWDPLEGFNVRTAYPHQAGTEAELSFQSNEVLNLAPREQQLYENSGWLLAVNQNGQVGYVPVTRLATAKAATSNANPATPPSESVVTHTSESH